MFADHTIIKLEINTKQKFGGFINMWKFKNIPMDQRKNWKNFEMNEYDNENLIYQNLQDYRKQSLKGIHSHKGQN